MSVSEGWSHIDIAAGEAKTALQSLARSASNSRQQIKPAENSHVFNMCEQHAGSTVPVGDQEPFFEGL
eukprot:3004060-Pleurochrysis_carterae.AAC.1